MWVRGQCHAPASLPRERDPVPILQELGRVPGLIWKDEENLVPQRDSITDCPAHNNNNNNNNNNNLFSSINLHRYRTSQYMHSMHGICHNTNYKFIIKNT